MRLRTFESFWLLKNGLLYTYPSLQKNVKTDILVIGAGITGALVSNSLVEQGYKVTLIDKRDIAMGSSAATTSMLQYEIDVPLFQLANKIGEHAAATCYSEGIHAIKQLEALVKKHSIDCGFEMKKSLYMAHDEKSAEDLNNEYTIRHKYKLGVQWLSKEDVSKQFGLQCEGGILSRTAASVDAYKLAHELIRINVQRGMNVFDQTVIEDMELNGKSPFVVCEGGYKIQCKKVVFCTGFESVSLLKEKLAKLFYTYACVSEAGIKIPATLKQTLVWDTDQPYMYMRTTDDGRLLIGGEDSFTNFSLFQQTIKEKKSANLLKKLNKILPGVHFIEDFSWGGTFGSTKDGLPYIGKSPEYEHALFVLGFGGNGITFSAQAMKMIPDLLEGKPNQLSSYYRFGR